MKTSSYHLWISAVFTGTTFLMAWAPQMQLTVSVLTICLFLAALLMLLMRPDEIVEMSRRVDGSFMRGLSPAFIALQIVNMLSIGMWKTAWLRMGTVVVAAILIQVARSRDAGQRVY